jgi:hypothetical protein
MAWIRNEHNPAMANIIGAILAVSGINPGATDPQPVDPLLPWLARRVSMLGQPTDHLSMDMSWLREWMKGHGTTTFLDVVDWYSAVRPPLSDDLTLGMAATHARAWHEEIAERTSRIPEIQEPVIWRWDDGWYVVRLETWEQFQQESAALGHCIGHTTGYFQSWQAGSRVFHSLRMPEGEPVATSEEAIDGEIHQLKGRRDMLLCPPHPAHAQALRFVRIHMPLSGETKSRGPRDASMMGRDALALLPLNELIESLRKIEANLDGTGEEEYRRTSLRMAISTTMTAAPFPGRAWWLDHRHEQDYATDDYSEEDDEYQTREGVLAATVHTDGPFPAPKSLLDDIERSVHEDIEQLLYKLESVKSGKIIALGWQPSNEAKELKYTVEYKSPTVGIWLSESHSIHNMAGISIWWHLRLADPNPMLDVTAEIGIGRSGMTKTQSARLGNSISDSDVLIEPISWTRFTIQADPAVITTIATAANEILLRDFAQESEEIPQDDEDFEDTYHYWAPRGPDEHALDRLCEAFKDICTLLQRYDVGTPGSNEGRPS